MNTPVAGRAFAAALLALTVLTLTPAFADDRDGGPTAGDSDSRPNRDRDNVDHPWRNEDQPSQDVDRDIWRTGPWDHERHYDREDRWRGSDGDGLAGAPPLPTVKSWYCAHPQGYYPQVQACNVKWQPVFTTLPQ